MTPIARWDDLYPHIIVLEMVPGNTWDDLDALFTRQKEMAASKDGPIAVIMDVSRSPEPPSSDTITRARSLFMGQPNNIFAWVLVGGNRLSEIMARVLRTAHVVRLLTAPNIPGAYRVIDMEMQRIAERI
jgi:hypothetical protein